MEPISFAGQVAVVTGAGAGLGRGYALELARRGASVVVNDVAAEAADAVVAEIAAAGGTAVASHATVATPSGGRAIVDKALEAYGAVHAVINNAGFVRGGRFEDIEPDALDELMQAHIGAVYYVTQPAWRSMREHGYGRVVLTGSTAGLAPMYSNSAYGAVKAATHGLGRALALEGAEHGILVNSVMPSAPTGIVGPPDYAEHFPKGTGDFLAPRRTVGSVAALVAYLASAACTISGETLSAVAGRYARTITSVTGGWVADPTAVTAEQVAAHVGEIVADEGSYAPTDFYDEMTHAAIRLGYRPGA